MAVRNMILAAAACLLADVHSASLRVSIPASHLLPNPNTLPASTHAVLTSGAGEPIKAVLKKGNYFDFRDIPTIGSHLLDIYSRDYVFAPYRIDVSPSSDSKTVIAGAWETYRGTRWEDRGVALVAAPTEQLDMSVKVLSYKKFYDERQGFNPISLLKSPMILMGIVALAFTFGMPKLMENMDPEMKAEYEEMQKKGPMAGLTKAMSGQGQASSAAQNFDLAGYLAGSGKSSGNDRETEGARERRR
jgi:ER membrane protein complex subunit 7